MTPQLLTFDAAVTNEIEPDGKELKIFNQDLALEQRFNGSASDREWILVGLLSRVARLTSFDIRWLGTDITVVNSELEFGCYVVNDGKVVYHHLLTLPELTIGRGWNAKGVDFSNDHKPGTQGYNAGKRGWEIRRNAIPSFHYQLGTPEENVLAFVIKVRGHGWHAMAKGVDCNGEGLRPHDQEMLKELFREHLPTDKFPVTWYGGNRQILGRQ
jgi:hypothetical protein